ncbi:MAG: GDP-mannose 4,6-dehydratase, partial [Methanobacterium sp.]
GPRQSARAVIPTIISQALTKNEIYLGSLEPTRDYTYVLDTIRAFIKIAESSKSDGEVINVGSNFEVSIGELAERIFSLLDKNVEIITDSNRIRPKNSEVERLWCDNTKAREILNWEPKISLKKGLENVIMWIKDNKDFYKSGIYNR